MFRFPLAALPSAGCFRSHVLSFVRQRTFPERARLRPRLLREAHTRRRRAGCAVQTLLHIQPHAFTYPHSRHSHASASSWCSVRNAAKHHVIRSVSFFSFAPRIPTSATMIMNILDAEEFCLTSHSPRTRVHLNDVAERHASPTLTMLRHVESVRFVSYVPMGVWKRKKSVVSSLAEKREKKNCFPCVGT